MKIQISVTLIGAVVFCLFTSNKVFAQTLTLDTFETTAGWSFIKSDGVTLEVKTSKGLAGNAICLSYNFTKGTGYGGIQKIIPLNLPENFEISFYLKAESPANNFEIKFIDSTGNNVWWVNNRNFSFPTTWQKIRIKPRHIHFAWGPTSDTHLKRFERIEFTLASFVGGSGKIWIDSLTFKPLPLIPDSNLPTPLVYNVSDSQQKLIPELMDQDPQSAWIARNRDSSTIILDLRALREIGGIKISWVERKQANSFDIYTSDDSISWQKSFSVNSNRNNISYIRLPEFETRYIRLNLQDCKNSNGCGIKDIQILRVEESNTLNSFFRYVAKDSPKGYYPRYFLDQASYWTVSGVNGDTKEALINEDGLVEVEKAKFSIEPVIKLGDKVYSWSNVKTSQSLTYNVGGKTYEFIPTVNWFTDDVDLQIGVTSFGKANTSSRLLIGYTLKNKNNKQQTIEFYLLIRPFQVNPYYQFLNLPGGVGTIHHIEANKSLNRVDVDRTSLFFAQHFNWFYASTFNNANPADIISSNPKPNKAVTDEYGLGNATVKYQVKLKAGQSETFYIIVPLHSNTIEGAELIKSNLPDTIAKMSRYWEEKTGHVRFNLPGSSKDLIKTYRTNLMYILINKDNYGIQPGSRSYERSWMRDGSLTSSALLKSGINEEVKEFIKWYAEHLYENGKVPCVVDFRGPDPVPEHDSHGQFIYLIHEYFSFTHDTAFLRSMNPFVLRTVSYIESLIAERSTDKFKYGNDSLRAFYGLVPESISHEGYSAKPMHSYWDNFFIIKGLKDACDIQITLGNLKEYERIKRLTDTFRENLYNSIKLTIKNHNINYIPGCAELGDFDATSTTVALTPCNEFQNLPKPELQNTFDKYYKYFSGRKTGQINWINFTPYENRIIGSFVMLNQPDRAHELIDYFLTQQRPRGWYHWAEVVWNDYRTPQFIGDMPHTWVGSDFINAFRNLFVYEDFDNQMLRIGAGLKAEWIDDPKGIQIENLPTYYGELSYMIQKSNHSYTLKLYGDIKIPANGIAINCFSKAKPPKRVIVNGSQVNTFSKNEIVVKDFPAEILVEF